MIRIEPLPTPHFPMVCYLGFNPLASKVLSPEGLTTLKDRFRAFVLGMKCPIDRVNCGIFYTPQ